MTRQKKRHGVNVERHLLLTWRPASDEAQDAGPPKNWDIHQRTGQIVKNPGPHGFARRKSGGGGRMIMINENEPGLDFAGI